MTDIFVGGEDTSVSGTGTVTLQTNGSGTAYRSSFARAVINVGGNVAPSTADPPANRALLVPAWTPLAVFWFHGQYSNNNVANSVLNVTLLRLLDNGGAARIVVRGTATSGQLKIETRNTAGTFTTLVTTAAGALPAKTTPTAIDLDVDYSATGHVTLYVDGVSVATYSGDITTNGVTGIAQADIATLLQTSTTIGGQWSEIIVRDSTTLGAGVFTVPPVAAGNTQSWTPNTVANVNKVAINDGTNVSTTSANALSEWTVATTLPVGAWSISSVHQEARVSRGASGPQNVEWLVRTVDGTDHVAGSFTPTTSLANYSHNWPTNPQSAGVWGAGDLINAGIESLA